MRDEKLSVKYLPAEAVESEKFDKNKKFFDGQSLKFYMDFGERTAQVTIEMPEKLEDNIAYICTQEDEKVYLKENIVKLLKTRAESEIGYVKEKLSYLLDHLENDFGISEFSWKMLGTQKGYMHQSEEINRMYEASKADLGKLQKWYAESDINFQELLNMKIYADEYIDVDDPDRPFIVGPHVYGPMLYELIKKAIEVYGKMKFPGQP